MKKRMDLLGIGSRLIVFSVPYLVLILILAAFFPGNFRFKIVPLIERALGLIFIAVGVAFLIWTLRTFVKGFSKNKLVMTGPYALCRNPIYASWIIFIIPGISLLADSWLVLTISLVMYIIFKLNIHREDENLTTNFGSEYLTYKKKANELLPFPHPHQGNVSYHNELKREK